MNLYEGEAWLDSGGVEEEECLDWLLGDFCGSILDVGCSSGAAAAHMARRGCAVTGLDIFAAALARAVAACPAGEFHLADAAALPFADGTFDAVHLGCMRAPLTQSGRYDAAIAEACRVLRPGGLLFVGDLGAAGELADFALLRQRDATAALRRFVVNWLWKNDEPLPCGTAKTYTLAVYRRQ